jgi:hypothetical protein
MRKDLLESYRKRISEGIQQGLHEQAILLLALECIALLSGDKDEAYRNMKALIERDTLATKEKSQPSTDDMF